MHYLACQRVADAYLAKLKQAGAAVGRPVKKWDRRVTFPDPEIGGELVDMCYNRLPIGASAGTHRRAPT